MSIEEKSNQYREEVMFFATLKQDFKETMIFY